MEASQYVGVNYLQAQAASQKECNAMNKTPYCFLLSQVNRPSGIYYIKQTLSQAVMKLMYVPHPENWEITAYFDEDVRVIVPIDMYCKTKSYNAYESQKIYREVLSENLCFDPDVNPEKYVFADTIRELREQILARMMNKSVIIRTEFLTYEEIEDNATRIYANEFGGGSI